MALQSLVALLSPVRPGRSRNHPAMSAIISPHSSLSTGLEDDGRHARAVEEVHRLLGLALVGMKREPH